MALDKDNIIITNPEEKNPNDNSAQWIDKVRLEQGIRHYRVHPLIKNPDNTFSYHKIIKALGHDCSNMNEARQILTHKCDLYGLYCCKEDIYKCIPRMKL